MLAEINVVEPFAKLIDRDNFNSAYQFLEKIGRVCYKSEDRITEDSAEKFVKMLRDNGHLSVLEHERINLFFDGSDDEYYGIPVLENEYRYSFQGIIRRTSGRKLGSVFSAPLRTFLEMQENEDLTPAFRRFLSEHFPLLFSCKDIFRNHSYPEIKILTREEILGDNWLSPFFGDILNHTLHLQCDRGVSHELVRHRQEHYSQESTRYCNYTKVSFGKSISFIRPFFWGEDDVRYQRWLRNCQNSCEDYFFEIEHGAKPEEARLVLNHSVKTEIIVSATENNWQHVVDVRYKGKTGSPHPQMLQLMGLASPILEKESEGRIKI